MLLRSLLLIVVVSYSLSAQEIKMGLANLGISIDPETGGRITSLMYDGKEFLTGRDINPDNYGSTLWPSPQSLWNWPPPQILDSEEYEIMSSVDTISLLSKEDEKLGVSIYKRFTISEADTSIVIRYGINNISEETLELAPWEITRMPKGGIVCFMKGETEPKAKTFDPIPYSEKNGIYWYKNNKDEKLDNHLLSVADGSGGWLAYILDGYVYIKVFEDVLADEQFDGEGEIAVYVHPTFPYVEIEAQGKKNKIEPGESLVWKMKWIIRKLPERLKEEYQNEQLIEFIHTLTSK